MADDGIREMTAAETTALLKGRHLAVITTNGRDGMPHSTPVWYLPDGDTVAILVDHDSVKARNLRRDRRASVLIASERRPYRYVLYRGRVELLTEGVDDYPWRIARRYLGEERARRYLAEVGDPHPPFVVIKASTESVRTWIDTSTL